MKEDLRYIERLCAPYTPQEAHPSEERLDALRRGALQEEEKEAVLSHLLVCERCSRRYVELPSVQRVKMHLRRPKKGTVTSVLLALAASLLLVLVVPTDRASDLALGRVSFAQVWQESGYKAPPIRENEERFVDMDEALSKILQATKMDGVPYYDKARQAEREASYEEARAYYKRALLAIRRTDDTKERMRRRIVLNYRLMLLEVEEEKRTQESIESYKKILRYEIALYLLKFERER